MVRFLACCPRKAALLGLIPFFLEVKHLPQHTLFLTQLQCHQVDSTALVVGPTPSFIAALQDGTARGSRGDSGKASELQGLLSLVNGTCCRRYVCTVLGGQGGRAESLLVVEGCLLFHLNHAPMTRLLMPR